VERRRLARSRMVRAVTPNFAMRATAARSADRGDAWNAGALATSFVQSTRTDKAWADGRWRPSGQGVTVAVIDTGIAGDLPDFRVSATDPASRVVATVVTNPDA